MVSLTGNIRNRVNKLPKPSNNTQALQPLFEAVSNSMYAVDDRYKDTSHHSGQIKITVRHIKDPEKIEIIVEDNGIGIDEDRYAAFCTVDTDFKRAKGGKGVGRLFWLDAFSSIVIESYYMEGDTSHRRCLSFELKNKDQITDAIIDQKFRTLSGIGTSIRFKGIRIEEYSKYFPKRQDTFLRYFGAHFISEFLTGSCPEITVDIDGKLSRYPEQISSLVVGNPMKTGEFELDDFGKLEIVGFTCDKAASTGLEGSHQLHLLAHGRTVETRKIDNLLGVESLTRDDKDDLVFHGCLSGAYLDSRVNEGRTAFNLPESILKEITRKCVDEIKIKLIPDQVKAYKGRRKERFEDFVKSYPIYGFDSTDAQLDRLPIHAKTPEDFASGLVKYQIRNDEDRQRRIELVIDALDRAEDIPENFTKSIIEAAEGIQNSERLALAQHVVRRKLVLEILEKLLLRLRRQEGKSDNFQLEKTLHSLFVPMNVRGDDPTECESRSHDLWMIDERLAFTRAFSSDKRLDQILKSDASDDRPDVVIWDFAVGMGVIDPWAGEDAVDISKPLSKVLIIEFKRPMRKSYPKAEDQIERQIVKYLSQLKGNELESFGRKRIRIAQDCIFHCFVVADIVGDLEEQLSSWETTANGEGRIRRLGGNYQGTIEVIQWQDLVNDAWQRNASTLFAAGLKRGIIK
ncbi:ATP-binding protein [Gluconacetobacter sacchari]|uniref:ATP-binding protein n=3 Tax=Gluconacetobacter sacchari TaxID=92759 RepID=A0A7W4IE27_9PROT|nr:ATP-binding protein [Gluconacetobacter sacchari]MBB2161153.1 ATP-binding protein [Gluconacetobacter sacchari]